MAAEPDTGLVALAWRAVEPLVHAPEAVQSVRIGGIGVGDDAELEPSCQPIFTCPGLVIVLLSLGCPLSFVPFSIRLGGWWS
jgi:hypothetical protein